METLTPFQTVGPYLKLGLRSGLDAAVGDGDRIVVRGQLLDGDRRGIPDGVLEFWHPALPTIQRALTTEDGSFSLVTIKPASVTGPDDQEQAPHFAVRVLGRGILTNYITRMYFPDEPRNASDRVLNLVPDQRRHTLIASRESDSEYDFDVVVQGQDETVFFDV